MRRSIRYVVVFDREVDGRVIAGVPGVPGCLVYGPTAASALRRIKKVLRFYLTSIKKLGKTPPKQPRPVAVEIQLAA